MYLTELFVKHVTPGGTYVYEFVGLRTPGVDFDPRTRVPSGGMNADFHNIILLHIIRVPSYGRYLPEGPSAHFLYLHDVLQEIIKFSTFLLSIYFLQILFC